MDQLAASSRDYLATKPFLLRSSVEVRSTSSSLAFACRNAQCPKERQGVKCLHQLSRQRSQRHDHLIANTLYPAYRQHFVLALVPLTQYALSSCSPILRCTYGRLVSTRMASINSFRLKRQCDWGGRSARNGGAPSMTYR